jgi:hypothetical protein
LADPELHNFFYQEKKTFDGCFTTIAQLHYDLFWAGSGVKLVMKMEVSERIPRTSILIVLKCKSSTVDEY